MATNLIDKQKNDPGTDRSGGLIGFDRETSLDGERLRI
jgi:hypothetical protein